MKNMKIEIKIFWEKNEKPIFDLCIALIIVRAHTNRQRFEIPQNSRDFEVVMKITLWKANLN